MTDRSERDYDRDEQDYDFDRRDYSRGYYDRDFDCQQFDPDPAGTRGRARGGPVERSNQ